MAPAWEQAATTMKGVVHFAKMDCTEGNNNSASFFSRFVVLKTVPQSSATARAFIRSRRCGSLRMAWRSATSPMSAPMTILFPLHAAKSTLKSSPRPWSRSSSLLFSSSSCLLLVLWLLTTYQHPECPGSRRYSRRTYHFDGRQFRRDQHRDVVHQILCSVRLSR